MLERRAREPRIVQSERDEPGPLARELADLRVVRR